ncbi:MAG: NAD(P)/FAD-dependent oxidoreductase [Alphaproteobacteria bacterium]|nr:NAD(P)/FAD-dependent oxidoreductase [Alphaproteobacteria bacterium]
MIVNIRNILTALILGIVATPESKAEEIIQVAIIGGGCAGLSAAMVTSEHGFDTIIFSGPMPGGDLNVKTEVGNWPGIVHSSGKDIMPNLIKQAERFKTKILNEEVVKIDFSTKPFLLTINYGNEYKAKKILIATGTKERLLDVPGAAENRAKLLYNSDIHKDINGYHRQANSQKIAIIGGGVDAMKKAFYALKGGAAEIHMFVRGIQLNLPPWRKKFIDKKSDVIKIHFNHDVSKIESLDEKRMRLYFKNGSLSPFDVGLVVVSAGRVPRSDLFKGHLDLDPKGLIKVMQNTQQTSVEGVYAAGDVTNVSGPQPQAGIAAGDGMRAGYAIVDALISESMMN